MFGPCKVCREKDKRIVDLLDQITNLRIMANPGALTVQIPETHREADVIMSANPDVLAEGHTLSEEEEQIISEANRLLSGTYE